MIDNTSNDNKLNSILQHFHSISEVTIGKRIRETRKQKGLTQKKLGELCGMSEAQISQYETGYRNPSYKTLYRIAEALEISKGDLIFGDSDYKFGDPEFVKEMNDLISTLEENLGEEVKQDNTPQWIYNALEWYEDYSKMDYWAYDWDIDRNASNPNANEGESIRKALKALVFYFFKLNPEGRAKLFERLRELNEMPRYTKNK